MADFDVVVIGSGAGGLAAALALARAGKRVMVFEQHYLPGGWCHSFPLGGYSFSPGVHYIGGLGPDGLMRRLYEGLGVSRHLTFLELAPDGYDRVRVGDERFDIPTGLDRYRSRLKERFPREARGIDRWLDAMNAIAAQIVRVGRSRNPLQFKDLLLHGGRSVASFLDGCTKDPLLRAILTVQAGDHGMTPARCPVAMHAAVVAHYFDGGWYPKGGGRALPKAFIKELRAHGGEVKVRAPVESLLVRDGRACGVRLAGGQEVSAEVVVSNADPHATWRLVPQEVVPAAVRRHLDRTRYSISALSLFFATDMDLEGAGLDSGNVWSLRTADPDAIYRQAVASSLDTLGELAGSFLTITTLKDRTKKAHGHHTGEAFTFVSNEAFRRWQGSRFGERPADYASCKERLQGLMVAELDRVVPGLARRLVFAEVGTPLTNSHYVASSEGNLYGTEKSLRQLVWDGWPLKAEVPGLWMCGASTLGHGVAGASLSGLECARRILGCRRSDLLSGNGPELVCLPADRPEEWPASIRPRGLRAVA